jgi:hypothetical protein
MVMLAISLWKQCTFWWDDDVSYIIVRTMYILMRWWCQLYHGENNVHSDEMMMSAISWWEQCTFWWDDDVSYIIVSTMYIMMRWWCQLYHCENNVHSDEMTTSHQNVHCSHHDIADIIISSECTLYSQWYSWHHHLTSMYIVLTMI